MRRLIHRTTAVRHHVGRRLDVVGTAPPLGPSGIPQLIDTDVYREVFAPMLGARESTGRMYVSLCVLRSVAPVHSWSDAATAIGVNPERGMRTARAASTRMHATPTAFADAVHRATLILPAGRDFRRREARVHRLARHPDAWVEGWRASTVPARRSTAWPFAVTWMWCEVAQGCLDTSPAWAGQPTPRSKACYRAFAESMPAPARKFLSALALNTS